MSEPPTIGFVTPPACFSNELTEFPTVVENAVRIQQAPLLLPDFDFHLDSFAAVQEHLNLCARGLQAMGCELVAQVGTPFSWAGTRSETEARKRCSAMQRVAGVPCFMTGLAIVDGLRAHDVTNIAVCCPYYESDWRDHFAAFLEYCGFNVLKASNLSDLGLADPGKSLRDYWSVSHDLIVKSLLSIARTSPDAEAIVIPGTSARTLTILSEVEAVIKRPIIAADTILYWAIARHLGLTLKPVMGTIARLDN